MSNIPSDASSSYGTGDASTSLCLPVWSPFGAETAVFTYLTLPQLHLEVRSPNMYWFKLFSTLPVSQASRYGRGLAADAADLSNCLPLASLVIHSQIMRALTPAFRTVKNNVYLKIYHYVEAHQHLGLRLLPAFKKHQYLESRPIAS